jgi:hypothetical protein
MHMDIQHMDIHVRIANGIDSTKVGCTASAYGFCDDLVRYRQAGITDGHAGYTPMTRSVHEARNLITILAAKRTGCGWHNTEDATKQIDQLHRFRSQIQGLRQFTLCRLGFRTAE